jgi:hypothetical protein
MNKITIGSCKFFIILSLTLNSCLNKDNAQKDFNFNHDNAINFSFDFPDTVFINEPTNGKINFEGILDTVTTDMYKQDTCCFRFASYRMYKTRRVNHNLELKHISKKITDTISSINNREIYLLNVKFNKLGINYIDGIISDEVLIAIPQDEKSSQQDSLFRYITNEVRAFHKVVVIKRP